jgi:hypothetical protein
VKVLKFLLHPHQWISTAAAVAAAPPHKIKQHITATQQ